MPDPEKIAAGWVESWEQLLAQNLPFKVFLKGLDLTYLACNENYAADHGLKPSQIFGRSDYDLYPRELAERYRTEDLRILETGRSETIEGHFLKDGQEHHGQTIKSLFRDSSGQTIGILGTFWDISELVQVKEALRESEELVSQFIRHSPIYAYIKEVTPTESRVLQASDNYQQMIGVSGQDMIGKTMAELFPREFAEKITADDWAAVADGVVLQLEEDLNGRNYTSIKFPIRQGDTTLLAGYTIDITDRQRLEEALRENEKRLIEAQRIGKIGSWEWNPAENKVIWSAEMYDIFGVAPETVLTTEISMQAFHSEDRAIVEEATRKTLAELKPQPIECRILKPDGTVGYVQGRGEVVLDADGQLVKMIGIYQDITERKRAEEALRESEEKFRRLIENSHDIIYTLTPDGVFTFVSPGWTALLGHPVDQVVGKPFQLFVHPDDFERCQVFLQKTIQSGQRQMGIEYRVLHADGSWRWHTTNAVPLKDEAGAVVGYEGVASDITDRKQLEGEMDKTRADFLFGVSHELKTPLFLMNISLEMLENSPESGKPKRTTEFMETWKRNLHRLQHLVFNMVDSQRTQAMGFKVERKWTDFRALIERVVQEHQLLAGPKKVRITMDLAPTPPLFIDPDAIHRLVENLLTNAVKFSPRGGEVTLQLAQEEAQAVLTVKDQGPGISAEEQKGLFLPFQRAATAVRSVIPGTGLGLYVAKIIADAHGGTISLRSKVGKGTTVTVGLPLDVPKDSK